MVGALYVGVKQENLESLRQGIMDIVVGKTGYVWVIGGKGEQRGHYIISKDGTRDGENLLNSPTKRQYDRTADHRQGHRPPSPERADRYPGEFHRYPWKNPGDPSELYKSVAITYFAPWDWVIGAAYYESDFAPLHLRVARAITTMAVWITLATLLMVLLAIPIGRLVAEGIRSRIDTILKSVHDVLIVTDSHDHIVLLSQAAENCSERSPGVRSLPISSMIADPEVCTLSARPSPPSERHPFRLRLAWGETRPSAGRCRAAPR